MVIQIENAEKNYDKFHLKCSMEVKKGNITGLVGQNGAGKTTLFKMILGMVSVDKGQIYVYGKAPKGLDEQDRQKIGMAFSDSFFSGYLTLGEVIRVCKKTFDKFDEQIFEERCRQLSLPLNKKMKDFSTGMMAKAKVITAISYQPELLILDEPTSGLDVVARDEVLELLREYMEEEEHAILISSHISSDLEGLCDDIYMIHKGEIVLHEDVDLLLSEYGLLKVDEMQFEKLDKKYLIRVKKENFGYSCLTNKKQFYLDNYPGIVVEKGNIDEVITMTIKGEML